MRRRLVRKVRPKGRVHRRVADRRTQVRKSRPSRQRAMNRVTKRYNTNRTDEAYRGRETPDNSRLNKDRCK